MDSKHKHSSIGNVPYVYRTTDYWNGSIKNVHGLLKIFIISICDSNVFETIAFVLMLLALLIPTSYLSVKVNYDISQVAFHIILEDNGHNNNFERCVNHRNHKKKKKNHFQIKNWRRFCQQEYSQWLVLWTGDTSFIMDIETTFSNNFPCRQLRISTITFPNFTSQLLFYLSLLLTSGWRSHYTTLSVFTHSFVKGKNIRNSSLRILKVQESINASVYMPILQKVTQFINSPWHIMKSASLTWLINILNFHYTLKDYMIMTLQQIRALRNL